MSGVDALVEELALGMVLGYDGEPSVSDTERLMARAAAALRELSQVAEASSRDTGATVYLSAEWDFETSMADQRRHKNNDAQYIALRCLDESDVDDESYTCEHPGCSDHATWVMKDAEYRTDTERGFNHYRCVYHVPKYLAYDAGYED